MFPADPDARVSSWAVVVDTVCPTVPQIQMLASYIGESSQLPVFQVVGSGIVFGHQSSSRGELIAFLKALQAASKLQDSTDIHIVTDATYVVSFLLTGHFELVLQASRPIRLVIVMSFWRFVIFGHLVLLCTKPSLIGNLRMHVTGKTCGACTVTKWLI